MGTEPSFSTEQKPILHTERKQTMKMKMQTNRIKRILSAILLLLLAVGMVTSCTKQTPEIEQPDEALLEQIAEDYALHMFGQDYDPAIDGTVTVSVYYGMYGGCVPVLLRGNWGVFPYEREEEVAGSVFYYTTGEEIQVWKDGDFFTIKEAYEQDLLSREQIAAIATIHEEMLFIMIA